ncbi:5-bromo-4-chloroindolyl phosphate hydrolysis family protein [Bacillus infantis]|uniref:5-bromo-4-chloroindolyl phosphate hydrolysis family protein n=1 Tax=Bacillus infantis TaxID=324767 RepID=UPI003CF96DFA
MNRIVSFLIGTVLAVPFAGSVWTVSYFGFDQTFFLSGLIAGGAAALVYLSAFQIGHVRFLRKHGLSRREYKYIKTNLAEGKKKISRLHKSLFAIRHLPSLKQRIELMRITRKIYRLTKKEPKRFYQAERFYFSHLDSLVEMTEKYVFLSTQPKKNLEIDQSLLETRRTINELSQTVEKDLYEVISDDIDNLNFEIDVAKNSIKTWKENRLPEESRRLK